MRVGEVAERAGVNVETLRYYERRGLLPEPGRTPNGHRRYDEESVRFVRSIKEAQRLGFTLAEIEEYVRAVGNGRVAASVALRVRMAAKIDEIDERLDGLRRIREELGRVGGCSCVSLERCTCGVGVLARRGRERVTGSLLHVTNGDSVAGPLLQTSLEGDAFAWADVYHEGPVRSGERDRMIDARAVFLASCGWGDEDENRAGLLARDARFVEALREGREIVLWFEHDLYDQLQLLDVLALAGETGFDPEQLELIEVGSFPGRPGFRGLGELTPAQLESLWPRRRAVTDADTAGAQLAWEAVRASDPRALLSVRRDPPASRPFLGAAFGRFLEELPGVRDGLSRTERQLLTLLAEGPLLTGALFVASQDLEEAPFHGDAWVFRTLAGLEGATPLVVSTEGSAAITDAGRRVLAGEADRIDLLGIDRWVGGTHLVPGAVWRWDGDASELVAPN